MLNLIIKETDGSYNVVTVKEDMVITPTAGQQFYFDNYSGSKYTFNLVNGDKSIELIINDDPTVKIVFNDMVDLISKQEDGAEKTVLSVIDNPTGIYDLQNTVMNTNNSSDDVINSLKEMLADSSLGSKDGVVIDDFGSLSSALDAAAAGGVQGDTSTFTPLNSIETAESNDLEGRSRLDTNVNNPFGSPDISSDPTPLTPTNQEATEVTITLSATSQITEDDDSITYTATLSTPALSDMAITLSNGSVINIPAGSSTGTVLSPITPDSDVYKEADQIVTTSISETNSGGFDVVNSDASANTTIVDSIDEVKVTVTADGDVKENEAGNFKVNVSQKLDHDLEVTLSDGS
ncbi:immunoglobulin-like domain-containing protein, partial [Arcobacter sp. CECT 8985]|uniref:immunoglobulin-like domain-containing protein n=1 Tax=Arcobacter sp. CECT 8985 TaxID=1935424 RepID=UPI0010256CF9